MFTLAGDTVEAQQVRKSVQEKFKMEHGDVDLEWLKKYACWLIMDPWEEQPMDENNHQNSNEHNNITINKIVNYIPEVRYWVISCDAFYPVAKKLNYLKNLCNNENQLHEHMTVNNLSAIVYVGLHHGLCILSRPLGAVNQSKYYPCYVYKPLTGLYINGEWSEEIADQITEPYAELIH